MVKRSTTQRKQKSRTELRQDVARNITALYSNPETPTTIKNALFSALGDLWNDVPTESLYESESYVLSLIEVATQEGGAR